MHFRRSCANGQRRSQHQNGAAEHGYKMVLLTVTTNILLQVADLCQGRILTTGPEQVAQAVELDTTVAALVEQRESLLVVGRSLPFISCHFG